MSKALYDEMKKYLDMGIATIPVRMREKDGINYGKFPAIKEWDRFCHRLPEDEELRRWSRIDNISGIAIVTGKASNICCIDIDTENVSLQKKIEDMIPYTSCIVKGNPKRAGKYLYRLYEYDAELNEAPPKQKVKNGEETVVDLLWSGAYIVIPPSIHSIDQDGIKTMYKWDNFDLTQIGMTNLTILDDYELKSKLDMLMRGMTKAEMALNLPKGAIDLSDAKSSSSEGHRHEDMVSYCASLIAKRVDPTTAIRDLLERDTARNNSDPYFLDKTKGHRTDNANLNATKFYFGNLETKNRYKKQEEYEVPNLAESKIYTPSNEWGEIVWRENHMAQSLPMFNYDWIPNDEIKKFIKDSSSATSVSPQMIYFYMLGGLSGILGNKLKIRPYVENSKYVETCNLYVGLVASSGERKTETTGIALKPLKTINKMAKDQVKIENEKNIEKRKRYEIKIAKLEKDYKQAIEASEDEDNDPDIQEIAEKKKALIEKMPTLRRFSLHEQNATVQKMYEIAEENNTGLFVEVNEFGNKWAQLQAKGSEQEKSFYMDGWDGRKAFSYKTKHQGDNEIEELCLSMGFAAQYDVMEHIVNQVANQVGMNDGLLQRFLIFCSDQKCPKVVDTNFIYPQSLMAMFEDAYYIEKSDEPIRMEIAATEAWIDFQNEINAKKENEKIPAVGSSLSKYTGLCLRMAGNLEVIKSKGKKPKMITLETIKTSIEIMKYAEAHLRFLFKLSDERRIENIVNSFKTSVIEDETTIRDLYRNHQASFGRNATEAMQVLERLANRNIIKILKSGRSSIIKINPDVYRY